MTGVPSRRSLIAGLAVASCTTAPQSRAPIDPLSGASLYADLSTYAAFGPKRTATAEDLATSQWLAQMARATGAAVQTPAFNVSQFFVEQATLNISGQEVACFPFWFPTPTNGVVRAPLAPLERVASGQIAVAFPPAGIGGLGDMPGMVTRAASAGASALLIVTTTPSGELFGHGQGTPTALPTLLVGSKDRLILDNALAASASADVEVRGQVDPRATAMNVIARIPGQGPLVVVSTPTSAWFTAAGERGPGVALWLGLMRWAMRRPLLPNMLFVAFSGHELRAAGARAFTDSGLAPNPADVALWVHLGASIATYRFARDAAATFTSTGRPSTDARLITDRQDLIPTLETAFAARTWFRPAFVEPDQARGELRLYFEKGYRAFGFEGAHDWFHAPGDLAFVSGPDLLEPVARGLVQTLTDLQLVA